MSALPYGGEWVVHRVAMQRGVSSGAVLNVQQGQAATITHARQQVMYELHECYGWQQVQVGALFGVGSSAVSSNIRQHKQRLGQERVRADRAARRKREFAAKPFARRLSEAAHEVPAGARP